jgi:hypothetical protein
MEHLPYALRQWIFVHWNSWQGWDALMSLRSTFKYLTLSDFVIDSSIEFDNRSFHLLTVDFILMSTFTFNLDEKPVGVESQRTIIFMMKSRNSRKQMILWNWWVHIWCKCLIIFDSISMNICWLTAHPSWNKTFDKKWMFQSVNSFQGQNMDPEFKRSM